jgi:uncharacterized membrane protein
MLPSDGAWGGTTENVEIAVDTCTLLAGQHYVLVHGLNEDGFWGPFTAIFLDITTPDFGVCLSSSSNSAQADPGMTVTYPMQVKNVGLDGDSYDISVTSAWDYDAPTTTSFLNPGETTTFNVQVTIPLTATNGESDTATVLVESQTIQGVQDSSSLTTTANFYDLYLLPPTAEDSGNPGNQVSYILQLTNHGNIADTYDLSASSIWPVTLPSSVGPVEPGASAQIIVNVVIPLDALPGDEDNSVITASSQGNSSKDQSSTLTTSVNAVYSFHVDAIVDTLTAHGRGTTVEFTVLITNTGNITDSYDVHVSPGGWPVDAPLEVGPVGKGETATVTITVHVPYDIVIGDSNSSKVIFISQGGTTGHQISLISKTTWFDNFIPLSQKQ